VGARDHYYFFPPLSDIPVTKIALTYESPPRRDELINGIATPETPSVMLAYLKEVHCPCSHSCVFREAPKLSSPISRLRGSTLLTREARTCPQDRLILVFVRSEYHPPCRDHFSFSLRLADLPWLRIVPVGSPPWSSYYYLRDDPPVPSEEPNMQSSVGNTSKVLPLWLPLIFPALFRHHFSPIDTQPILR